VNVKATLTLPFDLSHFLRLVEIEHEGWSEGFNVAALWFRDRGAVKMNPIVIIDRVRRDVGANELET
jgi:hypothetical protein